MSDQWFAHSNGEQMGPYTGEQLAQFAQDGNITEETMVWSNGMPQWVPASQVPGLFSTAPAALTPIPAKAAPLGARSPAPASSSFATTTFASTSPKAQTAGRQYPFFPVKSASFPLWLWTFLGGFICFIIAIGMLIAGSIAAYSAVQESQQAQATESVESEAAVEPTETAEIDATPKMDKAALGAGAATFGAAGILLFIGWIAMMASTVVHFIYLYRVWYCLQEGMPRTSPGKAVGFMFIPFFNIYWVFVALGGLPKDWNRIVSTYDDLKAAPRLSETTFLLYCIGMFIPPLAIVMMFPMMSQTCKGINFFAARRNPTAVAAR